MLFKAMLWRPFKRFWFLLIVLLNLFNKKLVELYISENQNDFAFKPVHSVFNDHTCDILTANSTFILAQYFRWLQTIVAGKAW